MKDQLLGIKRFLLDGNIPGQLVIQMTDRCNASCPQCGMRVTESFSRSSLKEEKLKQLINSAKKNHFQAVSFTGGEPFLDFDKLVRLITYAGEMKIPYIRTGTNGFIFSRHEKPGFKSKIESMAKSLAKTDVRNLWISIDSADPETHEKMRGFKGVIEGIRKSLPVFHENGIFPSANLGINRNINGRETRDLTQKDFFNVADYEKAFMETYQNAFGRFYEFVAELGFTMVNTCYPMSIDASERKNGLNPVYAASAVDDIIRFTGNEKACLYHALLSVIPKYRSKIRIFSPLCSLYALKEQYSRKEYKPYACRGGIDFFFISSQDGYAYPCGYRGDEGFTDLNLAVKVSDTNENGCVACDWECFRDPSELGGPFLQARSDLPGLIKKIKTDPVFFKYWMEDLKYYRACGLFSGRKPLNARRLQKFNISPHINLTKN